MSSSHLSSSSNSSSNLSLVDLEAGNSSGSNNQVWELRIKSFRDVTVNIVDAPTTSVAILKSEIRRALFTDPKKTDDNDEDRYIRLICKGRLLAPDTAAVTEFGLKSGDVVHAVVAPPGVRGGRQAAWARGNTSSSSNVTTGETSARRRTVPLGPGGRVLRQPAGEEESDSDEDDDHEGPTAADPRGFDRLRTSGSGLRRSEVRAIRAYFSPHVDRHMMLNPDNFADEPDPVRRRWLMEEEWMSLQGPSSEFRLNLQMQQGPLFRAMGRNGAHNSALFASRSSALGSGGSPGTDRDFFWGFLLGFCVGYVMLLWVWMPSVHHKTKLGILTGISFQLALNVARQQDEDEPVFLMDSGQEQPGSGVQDLDFLE